LCNLQLTPDEVCTKHGLNNIDIEYTEENFQQWTSYKLYADHVRPMVLKENPKVSMTRLVQLIAAKWREFDTLSPYREQIHSAAKKTKEGTEQRRMLTCFEFTFSDVFCLQYYSPFRLYRMLFVPCSAAELEHLLLARLGFVCLDNFFECYTDAAVMCPHPFVFPWAVESSPLQFLALA